MLQQDKATYSTYAAYFADLPLTLSPFPVADYDYAVASFPLELRADSLRAKGISIGFYPNPDSDEVSLEMAFFVVTDDSLTSENSFVQSRNYPYLTAQGMMCFGQHTFDWIFVQSPQENAYLFVNMKLFDLQFGKTVLVYPQADGSFYYRQLNLDPAGYTDLEKYQAEVIELLLR